MPKRELIGEFRLSQSKLLHFCLCLQRRKDSKQGSRSAGTCVNWVPVLFLQHQLSSRSYIEPADQGHLRDAGNAHSHELFSFFLALPCRTMYVLNAGTPLPGRHDEDMRRESQGESAKGTIQLKVAHLWISLKSKYESVELYELGFFPSASDAPLRVLLCSNLILVLSLHIYTGWCVCTV